MKKGLSTSLGCSFPIIVLIINLLIGGWSVNTILLWFGKDIPFLADTIIGLFAGEITIPVAIIGKILKVFGVF